MKIFFVKTQTDCNPHRLHSLDIAEFSTTDLAEVYRVFNDEVAQLRREYVTAEYFKCTPNDKDISHAVYCSIIAIDSEDDSVIDFCEDSEYFFEK